MSIYNNNNNNNNSNNLLIGFLLLLLLFHVPGTQVMSEIEKVVEKEKIKEQEKEIIPSDPLLEYFKNADKLLNDNFILAKKKMKLSFKILKNNS